MGKNKKKNKNQQNGTPAAEGSGSTEETPKSEDVEMQNPDADKKEGNEEKI